MSRNARDRRPYIKPVTRVELSESNVKLRWLAICVLLAIAVVAIGYGFSLAMRTEPGWQEVTVRPDEINCSKDFTLMYDFGAGDVNPTAQYKKMEILYAELTEEAYRLFRPEAEGTDNLYALNTRVNEVVTVAPALYQALNQIVESGNRHVFLAPVLELYDPVFLSSTDAEAALYDPMKEPERQAMAREMAGYCTDPAMVDLQMLGNNQAMLIVSEPYLSYAEEHGIDVFLDLGWMTNAFIIDYMAQALQADGHVYGYLTSVDGFTRNLDIRSTRYSQNIFHCRDNTVYMPAILDYVGEMSLVTLRNYPMSEQDRWKYYAYGDGTITNVFLNMEDGLSQSGIDGITAYSVDSGCAWMLLRLAPVFTAEEFDVQSLEVLAQEGIYGIYCQDQSVIHTEESAQLSLQDTSYKASFYSVN